MAIVEIKVPSPGESISEVRIAQWLVKSGDTVEKDQVIAEIDSDKATLELSAEAEGRIELTAAADATVNVGDVVAKIDTSVKAEKKVNVEKAVKGDASTSLSGTKAAAPATVAAPAAASAAHATPVAKAMLEEKGVDAG